jgi:ATP phosphoribosyltransferase
VSKKIESIFGEGLTETNNVTISEVLNEKIDLIKTAREEKQRVHKEVDELEERIKELDEERKIFMKKVNVKYNSIEKVDNALK